MSKILDEFGQYEGACHKLEFKKSVYSAEVDNIRLDKLTTQNLFKISFDIKKTNTEQNI